MKRRARTRVPEQIGRVPPNYLIIFQMGNPEGTRWLYWSILIFGYSQIIKSLHIFELFPRQNAEVSILSVKPV